MTIDEILKEVEINWGKETVEAIKKKIDEENVIYSGNLKTSVRYETGDSVGNIQIKMDDYGKFQDLGVNPVGGALYETEFIFKGNWQGTALALQEWASSKGLNEWAVARKIQYQTGLEPKKFYTSVLESRLPVLGEALMKAYQDYLDSSINRTQT